MTRQCLIKENYWANLSSKFLISHKKIRCLDCIIEFWVFKLQNIKGFVKQKLRKYQFYNVKKHNCKNNEIHAFAVFTLFWPRFFFVSPRKSRDPKTTVIKNRYTATSAAKCPSYFGAIILWKSEHFLNF